MEMPEFSKERKWDFREDKLMDENQTLYKLKELEYLEKICENVGNISVTGGQDLLTQLAQILKNP